jgi:Spy/CpxP family protein refolding chaperone
MSRRRLLTAALAVVCLIALSASAVALARSSSSDHHATSKPAVHHVGKKHGHKPCPKHHHGDGRMTPGGRSTSAPLT